ncbi:MAG TPA: hypothetical protein PLA68_13895, partial [Panacibacter sp.]|nr:hypothetical protein [Panacibacter sp.]
MKKIIFILSIALASLSSYAQEGENIELLKRKIDSLEHRLDEKNYTRVPNGELEKELNAKVRDEVNGWFSSNFLVGGGFLAALVTVILTFGRRLITKELNDKLKKNVDEEANILKYRFDEHRNGMKEDFKELKETIGNKLTDTQNDMRKYREESIELFEKYKAETAESFQGFVNEKFTETESKITDVQAELNETVAPLFNQSVDAILQKATSGNTKNDKDEDLVK